MTAPTVDQRTNAPAAAPPLDAPSARLGRVPAAPLRLLRGPGSAVVGPSRGWGLRLQPGDLVPDAVPAVGVAVIALFPVLLVPLGDTLRPAAFVLALACLNDCTPDSGTRAVRALYQPRVQAGVVGGLAVVFLVLLCRLLLPEMGAPWTASFARLAVLGPLAAVVGCVLTRSGRMQVLLRWLVVGGVVSAVLALVERVTEHLLLTAEISRFARNDHVRAVVGAEHPLLLAASLVCLIPLVFVLHRRVALPVSALLLAGVWASDSSVPMGVGLLVLGLCVLPRVRVRVLRRGPLVALLIGVVAVLAVGSRFWSDQVTALTTPGVSAQYRQALYHLMPQLLAERPFGFGPQGIPAGRYLFATVVGFVDAQNTIDSEVVYAAFQFGVIGLVVLAAVAVLSGAGAATGHAPALSAFAISLVGLSLALHAWNSMTVLWGVLLGSCLAVVLLPPQEPPPPQHDDHDPDHDPGHHPGHQRPALHEGTRP